MTNEQHINAEREAAWHAFLCGYERPIDPKRLTLDALLTMLHEFFNGGFEARCEFDRDQQAAK